MAFEWFMAFDHLPATATGRAMAVGDGALTTAFASSGVTLYDYGGIRRLRTLEGNNSAWTKNVPNLTELVFGVRFVVDGGSEFNTARAVIGFYNGSTLLLNLYRNTNHTWDVRRGTTTLASDIFSLGLNVDAYIEISAKIDATAGDYTIRLHTGLGMTEASASGVNTGNAVITSIQGGPRFYSNGSGTSYTYMYARERPESQLGFYGPIVMRRLDIDSDISTDWVPDTGSVNYSRLTGVVDTASYVTSDTLDDTDEYGIADLPTGINSIISVVRYNVSEAPDGGSPQVAQGLKRGTTEKYVTNPERMVGVSASPATQLTPHMTQPDGSPWSVAAVDDISALLKAV
jgi:hypothetical protein